MNELSRIIDFLCGAAPFKGAWWDERLPGVPTFWWRNDLRAAFEETRSALEQSATEIKGLKDEIAVLLGQVPRYISPAQFHAEHHLWWKVTEHGTAFIVLPYPFKNIQQPTTNQSALHAEGGKEI
jgi:hypothetical protein